MIYAYVFYNSIIFRFEPNRMTFRDLDDYDKKRRNTYTELNQFTKNGLDVNKNNTKKPSWEEYVAITAWSCFILESRNTQKFKEFYELFEKKGSMKHYIFFYTENFTYRMSKGLIEAYDKEKKEWGKVATYTLPSDFDFKSLVGCMITDHFGFLTAANGELHQFINYKDTAPRFLEFLDIIEKGVDVEDEG